MQDTVLTTDRNEELFIAAKCVIPGGVHSPVRAFSAVGGNPKYIQSAQGAYIIDEDQRRYIDYVGSWGPMILGHAHPAVIAAVKSAADKGLSFGAPCEAGIRLSETICKLIPSIDKIRMVNSGTEATMSAIRLARGFTGRDKIIKFEGCYHGHVDSLLIKSGSGALTHGHPSSPGVTRGAAQDTLVAQYNDLESALTHFAKHGNDIAAIIVEPIAGNMNLVPAKPEFLEGLRNLCDQYGALLIFDEVMTGFRVHRAGAQALYDITPDLTCLGKIIGGGMPVGAFGGRADIMDMLSPNGPVYQAGTLSGNPLAMAAGLATISELQKPGIYDQLESLTHKLVNGVIERAKSARIPFAANATCGMFGFFFTELDDIDTFSDLDQCDLDRFSRFFNQMLQHGIYLAPSAFETGFISLAHSGAEIDLTLEACEKVFDSNDF